MEADTELLSACVGAGGVSDIVDAKISSISTLAANTVESVPPTEDASAEPNKPAAR